MFIGNLCLKAPPPTQATPGSKDKHVMILQHRRHGRILLTITFLLENSPSFFQFYLSLEFQCYLCYFLRQYKPVRSVRLLKPDGRIKANVFWVLSLFIVDLHLLSFLTFTFSCHCSPGYKHLMTQWTFCTV